MSSAKVSLGDVAAAVLDAALPETSAPPILAKKRSLERRVDEAKRQEREAVALTKAKKVVASKQHSSVRITHKTVAAGSADGAMLVDVALEASLRRIATRGVVQLFNSVRAAQRDTPEDGLKKAAKRPRHARGTAEPAPAGT